MTKIEQIVISNLEDAKKNGCWEPDGYLIGYSAEDIAQDMVWFAEDCQDLDPKDILGYIRAWLKKEKLS